MKERRMRLRRVVFLCLVMVAVGAAWFAVVQVRRYQDRVAVERAVEAIRARGELIDWKDFARPTTAPADNAAIFFRGLAERVVVTKEEAVFVGEIPEYPLTAGKAELADVVVKKNAAIFGEMGRAPDAINSNWELPTEQVSDDIWEHLGIAKMVRLGELNCVAADRLHDAGNDVAAIHVLENSMELARALRKMGVLLSDLCAGRIERRVCLSTQEIVCDLPSKVSAELRGALTTLQRRLLDDRENTSDWEHSILAERALFAQQWLRDAKSAAPGVNTAVARLLDYMGSLVGVRTWPEGHAKELKEAGERFENVKDDKPSLWIYEFSMGIDADVWFHFKSMVFCKMAGTAIGVRLYEIDHGGNWPTDLDTLVKGGYLTEVPRDPLAANGPIKLAHDGDGLRIYSVGKNGVDDGGTTAWSTGTVREHLDIAFYVVRPVKHLEEIPETQEVGPPEMPTQ